MAISIPVTQNPALQNSFLGSEWLNPAYLFNQGAVLFQGVIDYFKANGSAILSIYHTILFILALFFLTVISYCLIRVLEIRKKEHKHLAHELAEYAHHQAEQEKKAQTNEAVSKNPEWVKTLGLLFSEHAGDWKLAVIEADTMLEVLMSRLGFAGATLGDKLKSATQEKFKHLSSAWEVHTVRNKIAHEGAAFEFSQREAKRIIALYEQIFREYGFI